MVQVLEIQETLCCGCEEPFEDDALTEVKGGVACEPCLAAVFVTCCACRESIHEMESLYVGRTSERYCFDCAERWQVVDPDRSAD